ncbi:uncharacterized protein LOC143378522 [Andrena cerasifolii]|uniref:uncharacterized protein LOC143378522 n=1 Tax=Andrena cerasifolii TaxID=2819439 RepID=UPI0040377B53
MNVFVLLANISLVLMFDFCVSAKTYSTGLNDDITDSSEGLTVVPPPCGITKDTSMTLNKQKADHKYDSSLITKAYRMIKSIRFTKFNRNLKSYQNKNAISNINDLNLSLNRNNAKHRTVFTPLAFPVLKFASGSTERDRKWYQHVADVRLQKRSTVDKDDNVGKNMLIGIQRKAKVLGRLLLNNGSGKNDNDIQDDYVEDEDDDYSYGVNKKKLNWEDYQNEDGASIMELIALNTRHKTYMQPDEYPYRSE